MRRISILTTIMIVALVASCHKVEPAVEGEPVKTGDLVVFGVHHSEAENFETKVTIGTSYTSDDKTYYPVKWQTGDLVRIYSHECSEPTAHGYGGEFGSPNDHYTDYEVTASGEGNPTIHIRKIDGTTLSDVGLRWGDIKQVHYFNAIYPSPEIKPEDKFFPYDYTKNEEDATNVNGVSHIKRNQSGTMTKSTSGSNTTYTVAPDLDNMYLVARSKVEDPSKIIATDAAQGGTGGQKVFLKFQSLCTMVDITISSNDGEKIIEYAGLHHDTYDLSGAFRINYNGWSDHWDNPTALTQIATDYPPCFNANVAEQGLSANYYKNALVDFFDNVKYPEKPRISSNKKLNFRLFISPVNSNYSQWTETTTTTLRSGIYDMWFIVKHSGSAIPLKSKLVNTKYPESSSETRNRLYFPNHKICFLSGIIVPEGIKWTIKYATPTLDGWTSVNSDKTIHTDDAETIVTVTPWEEVREEDIDFQ